ncbi:MAG: SBBP repeat-containing protein, partial [Anaerolineae bacterium]
ASPLGGQDGFVAQVAPDGRNLVFSTFVGGSGDDSLTALAVGSEGTLFLAGATASADFPTTAGAVSTALRGPRDAVLARLTPGGAGLLYATYLGGSDVDQALAVAVDTLGNLAIAGSTASADFPVTPGAFDASYNGGGDAFIARLALGVWAQPLRNVYLPLLLRR